MSYAVYLRPLRLEDAKISYKWRNDSEIWKFTGSRPDRHITYEMEKEWLYNSLQRKGEKRFAICLQKGHRYIGNTQLIDIKRRQASFHLFIGDKTYWGKGIGREVTYLILRFAFSELSLQQVSLEVHKENIPALSIYKCMGFLHAGENRDFWVMLLTKARFSQFFPLHASTAPSIIPTSVSNAARK